MDGSRWQPGPELRVSGDTRRSTQSAPVLWDAFSWWQEEGGRADDVTGPARPLLRDLLMAQRVFDDSCKNLRLRVSFHR